MFVGGFVDYSSRFAVNNILDSEYLSWCSPCLHEFACNASAAPKQPRLCCGNQVLIVSLNPSVPHAFALSVGDLGKMSDDIFNIWVH